MSVRTVLGWLLLLAAALSGWSLWKNRVSDQADGPGSGRSEYVLRDFELVALDQQGRESFTLRAPLLLQTQGARSMNLSTPLFLLPDRGNAGKYWQVRSNTGWVSDNRQEIRLRGDVVADGPRDLPRPVTMKTQALNVFPDKREATSGAVVNITQPGLTMRGRGLHADLDAKRYTLKSQVRSQYVSTRR